MRMARVRSRDTGKRQDIRTVRWDGLTRWAGGGASSWSSNCNWREGDIGDGDWHSAWSRFYSGLKAPSEEGILMWRLFIHHWVDSLLSVTLKASSSTCGVFTIGGECSSELPLRKITAVSEFFAAGYCVMQCWRRRYIHIHARAMHMKTPTTLAVIAAMIDAWLKCMASSWSQIFAAGVEGP